MKHAVPVFLELLRQRIDEGTQTDEEAVRFTFLLSLVTTGFARPHEIVLNYKPAGGPAIHTMIAGDVPHLVSFQYDREGNNDAPRTQRAAMLVAKALAMAAVPDAHRALVYVNTHEMHEYLQDPRNRFSKLYEPVGDGMQFTATREFLADERSTVQRALAGLELEPCHFRLMHTCTCANGHRVKVWDVSRANTDL